MGRVAYVAQTITGRLDGALAHRGLPPLKGEPSSGELIRILTVLALDPLLLLSNLDGFDGRFDDDTRVYSNSPRNGDHL